MDFWKILGIQPTEDENAVRDAYLAKLPLHHPEEDPEGFRALRQAMEEALKQAQAMRQEKKEAQPMMDNSDIRAFLKKAEEIYQDCWQRFSPEAWKSLFAAPVCQNLETQKEAGQALLGFLMDHNHIPHSCYQMFDQFFGWTDMEEELYQHFPEGFVEYLLDRIQREDYSLRYDLFEQREGFDYDKFCTAFFALRKALNQQDQETAEAAFRELDAMEMDHPDLALQKIRHVFMLQGQEKQAWDMAKELYSRDSENFPTRFWYVQTSLKYEDSDADPEEIGELISSLLKWDPESPSFWQLLGIHLRSQGDVSQALLAFQKAKEYSDGTWERLDEQIVETADELSHLMEEDLEFHDDWQLANVCWMAHRYDLARQLLEAYAPDEEQKMSWLFLLSGCCHALEDYETAAGYRQKIWDATPPEDRAYALYLDLAGDYEKSKEFSKAIEIYLEAEEAFPDIPEGFCRHANLLSSNRKYEEALELCDQALKSGYHRDAFQLRLEMLLELERYQEVREDVENILKQGTPAAQTLFYYAKALRLLREYQETEPVLKALYERTGGAGAVCQEYASLCYSTNRSEEALEWVERALKQNDTLLLRYRKAEYLHDLKRYQEELAIYQELERLGADNDYIHYRTGRVLYSMEQYEEAEARLRKSLEMDPRYTTAWDMLGDVLQCQGKWEDAAWAYEEGWKLGDRQSIRDLSRLMKRTHQHERAMEYLEQGLKKFPDDGSLLWIKAAVLSRLEKYEEAVRCLGRYMEVKPAQTCSAYREIALFWERAEDYRQAEAYYQKAIDHDPGMARNWRALGKYYAKTKKDPETALPYLEKAIQLDADVTYGWLILGEVYETLGQKEKAFECYETSLKNYEKEVETDSDRCCSYEGLADALVHLGRLEEAEEMARRAISLQNAVFTCSSPVCYEGLEDLAKAEERRGNLEKALEWMKQAGEHSLSHYYPKEIARLQNALEQARTK